MYQTNTFHLRCISLKVKFYSPSVAISYSNTPNDQLETDTQRPTLVRSFHSVNTLNNILTEHYFFCSSSVCVEGFRQYHKWKQTNSHVAALTSRSLGQQLWCLPFLPAGIIFLSGSLVLPCVNPMQAPKLGREVLGDQDAAGTDVSMEEVFAVKELLIGE